MHTPTQALNITDKNANELIQANSVVLIDCWAPWCRPCRELGPIIDELATDYANYSSVLIGKLNIDENPAFVTKHSIKSIPTLLFFQHGAKVHQLVGGQHKSTLTAKLNELKG